MTERRKTIWVVVVLLVTGANALADLMPLSVLDAGDGLRVSAGVPSDALSPACPSRPVVTGADCVCPNAGALCSLPAVSVDAPPASISLPPETLTGDPGSLDLCLCVLMGLGLYRSAPLVKKLHIGGIPDWYYSGGPYRIGHSVAMTPDCRARAADRCFVQPDATEADDLPRCFPGTTASVLQGLPGTLIMASSRAPPGRS